MQPLKPKRDLVQDTDQNCNNKSYLLDTLLHKNNRLYKSAESLFDEGEAQIQLLTVFPEQMLTMIKSRTNCSAEETVFNFCYLEDQQVYCFNGYPQGDYLKQVCVIMCLWKQMAKFPILFTKFPCLQNHDLTDQVIENLNKLTPIIDDIFYEVNLDNRSPRFLLKQLATFFIALQPRGLLTCLGLRKTVASQDSDLPPDKQMLLQCFNRLQTVLDPSERLNNPNVPLLTKGARAFQKHSNRKTHENFWGPSQGITDKQRNQIADKKVRQILNSAVWLNTVTLNKNSTQVFIEVRIQEGFGARWDINYDFRGLLEPQDDSLNARKQ